MTKIGEQIPPSRHYQACPKIEKRSEPVLSDEFLEHIRQLRAKSAAVRQRAAVIARALAG
ncbi:MAG TPA: hypothetical protein VHW09_27220 [Bryobacteraceae bacterium]|jgi:hypothetical protein|nr:hypothetical protein [Bryobacteraceae bacterium]